jgi:RNA exonuclease 1
MFPLRYTLACPFPSGCLCPLVHLSSQPARHYTTLTTPQALTRDMATQTVQDPVAKPSAIQPSLTAKVSLSQRKKTHSVFLTEFKRLCPNDMDLANSLALQQEESLHDQSSSKTYVALAVAVKRRLTSRQPTQDLPTLEPIFPSLAQTKSLGMNVDQIVPLIATEEQMMAMMYPSTSVLSSEKPTVAIVCKRCSKPFELKHPLDAEDLIACTFHERSAGRNLLYPCCQNPLGSSGCTQGPHVWKEDSAEYLHHEYPFSLLPLSFDHAHAIVAMDCEMSYTLCGMELTRLTLVDGDGKIIIDELVKTRHPVIDFNTRYSGISSLDSAIHDFESIRELFQKKVSQETIVIGHG